MKRLLILFKCFFHGHKWTCKAMKGIKPNHIELANPILGFKMYSEMFCDRCGKVSKLNSRI